MKRDTKKAFNWIINILKKSGSKFQLSGGFAANLYGSKRDLADIDIDVEEKKFPIIHEAVKDYVTYGPKNYRDEEFDLMLMSVNYAGQDIDLSGSDSCKIYDKINKKWVNEVIDFKSSEEMIVFGKKVPVIPLKKLLAYKKKIRREVDLIDIKNLEKQ